MSNAFAKKFGTVNKAVPNPTRSNTLLPRQTALDAAASTFVKKGLVGDVSSISARDIHDSADVFAVYKRSNAIGDICGHGRKNGGIGLKRSEGGFEVTTQNLRRAVQVLSDAALSKLLADLEFADVDVLSAKIDEFPNEEHDDDDDSDAEAAGGNSGDDDDGGNTAAVADADDDDADQADADSPAA